MEIQEVRVQVPLPITSSQVFVPVDVDHVDDLEEQHNLISKSECRGFTTLLLHFLYFFLFPQSSSVLTTLVG